MRRRASVSSWMGGAAQPEDQREGPLHGIVAHLVDERPPVGAPADSEEPQFFERPVGFANRHAARVVAPCHFPLRGQFFAGGELAARDLALDSVGEVV